MRWSTWGITAVTEAYQFLSQMQSGSLQETRADAVSACNIVTYEGDANPVLLLKTYVSGPMGHIDTLGYVITELSLQEDNTWKSNSYFLLDSCNDEG